MNEREVDPAAEVAVPGCATGASQPADIEQAVRFCVEVAKACGAGRCRFYDPDEYARLVALYGSMRHLQARDAAAGLRAARGAQ